SPVRPRGRMAAPALHGPQLGATHRRCATALLEGNPRACTDAIGTPHESLKQNGSHAAPSLVLRTPPRSGRTGSSANARHEGSDVATQEEDANPYSPDDRVRAWQSF